MEKAIEADMELSKPQKQKMPNNLQRTLQLIELHQELKLSLYRALQPDKSEAALLRLLNQERLLRKSGNGNEKRQ